MDDLIRLISFKARIRTGKEYYESFTDKEEGDVYAVEDIGNGFRAKVPFWLERQRRKEQVERGEQYLPRDDLFSGRVGMVVGYAEHWMGPQYLVVFPNETPRWYFPKWLESVKDA